LEMYDKPSLLLPVVHAASNAAMQADVLGEVNARALWLVSTAASRQERWMPSAPAINLTILETPAATCLRRIAQQNRAGTTDWAALVEQWWRDYRRPDESEGWAGVEIIQGGGA
jgi:hypothetical protein